MDDRQKHAAWDGMIGASVGASVPLVTWTPEVLAELDRARRKLAFWARWHPLPSRRAKNRQALAILDGLKRGIRVSSFYEQAAEMGRRYAASVAHGAGKK
jgi:hypothetical protein